MGKHAKRHRSRGSVAHAQPRAVSQPMSKPEGSGHATLDVMRQCESGDTSRDLLRSQELVRRPLRPRSAAFGRILRRIGQRLHGRRILAAFSSAVALLLFLWALAVFVRADGSIEVQLPRRAALVPAGRNLVAAELGPTVRASSYLGTLYLQHHPAFVVDGMTNPTKTEKWASSPRDRSPRLELQFREPANVSRVVIQHAGTVEDARYTARNYAVRCVDAREGAPVVTVRDNRMPRREHVLSCLSARGVRIDFDPADSPDGIVRVYEVEVLSQ